MTVADVVGAPTTPHGVVAQARAVLARAARTAWEIRYVRRLVVADLAVALAAGTAAFSVRFGQSVTPYNRAYVMATAIFPVLFIAALAVNRAYERRFLFVGADEYQRVIRGGVALTAGVALAAYTLELPLARGYVVIALPVATLGCVVGRFAMRKRLHRARARGAYLRRVVVVGHAPVVDRVTGQLRRERYHGLEVVGACLPPFDDISEAVDAAAADTVIVLSCPELDGVALRRLAWRLERDDVDLIVASALLDVAGNRTTIRPVDGLPMLHVEHPALGGVRRMIKAVVDRLGAAMALVLLAPVLAVLAILILRDSPGPAVFRQVRVGRGGAPFEMYKFRTMHVDAEASLPALRERNDCDGVLFKLRADPRVTGVGRWLRRFSLDELPQLFNVLRGDMSLVGPRPPLPAEAAAYPADMRRRLEVKPGLTGLWQISGRADLPWEEAVRLDLRYVENWSLSLDLVIMLRTMTAVWRGRGAY